MSKHGCENCNGDSGRKELVRAIINANLVDLKKPKLARCDVCSAQWSLEFYEDAGDGGLCVRFSPVKAVLLQ
jgi:hypothetical protein